MRSGITPFLLCWIACTCASVSCNSASVQGEEITVPGFTEAVQKVEVAASETGLLRSLNVKEGDLVTAGELLGKLDDEIQKAQLEIAIHLAKTKGETARVESELRLKQSILEHFKRLSADGFAQQKEIIRAQMEAEVAQSNLLARQEKTLEYLKRLELAKIQLLRREIRSPISGIVSEKHRSVGEFISVNQPKVVTVVQTNPIRGKFQIPLQESKRFQVGDAAVIEVAGQRFKGTVESIGLSATSETVPVNITIDNSDSVIKLGQKCSLVVSGAQFTATSK